MQSTYVYVVIPHLIHKYEVTLSTMGTPAENNLLLTTYISCPHTYHISNHLITIIMIIMVIIIIIIIIITIANLEEFKRYGIYLARKLYTQVCICLYTY